jgi:hypothetical protein
MILKHKIGDEVYIIAASGVSDRPILEKIAINEITIKTIRDIQQIFYYHDHRHPNVRESDILADFNEAIKILAQKLVDWEHQQIENIKRRSGKSMSEAMKLKDQHENR